MTSVRCFSLNQVAYILFSKSYYPFFRFKSEILPLRCDYVFSKGTFFPLLFSLLHTFYPFIFNFPSIFIISSFSFTVPLFSFPLLLLPPPHQYSPWGEGVYFPQIYRHRSSSRRIFHQCPRHNFGSFFQCTPLCDSW
jgi:hypothetical protein